MKTLSLLILLLTTPTQAFTISTREISKKENESQVRMYIQNNEKEITSNFKAYYYIKGENLKVIDNYTPNCSLSVEKLANNVSRIVLDYTVSEKIHEFSLPDIIPNTSGLMFTIYSENGYYDRTENPSHIESKFFKINDSIDIIDKNGKVIYGNQERVYRYINISISPNPVANILNIKYEGNRANYEFELVNTNLNTIKNWQTSFTDNEKEIHKENIANLPSGIYTLRVKQFGNVVKVLQFYKD